MSSMPHSHCVQYNVGGIGDAQSVFSTKNATGQIPLVLIPSHRSPFQGTGWWLTIPTGCYCLMQRFGKDIGIQPPGGSLLPPYYRIAYIVTMQSCTYNAPVKECPTADNVRVGVDCVLIFAIRDPVAFVYRLGAVRFDLLLSGAVDEGIRSMVRAQSHQTVRMLRGNRADELLKMLNGKFDDMGVSFSNCTITSVTLPEALESSLEHTTEMKKAMDKTKREHEFVMGELQRKADMELEELGRKNEQTIVMEQGKKKRAELEMDQQMVKQNELTQTATIEGETKAQVNKMEARAKLDRAKINMERQRVQTISQAEADAEARRVQADIKFQQVKMESEAEKQQYFGQAAATKLDAEAEAKATLHLTHKRKHELEMREKEVLQKLAQKANYNLYGDAGDKLVEAMMSGHLKSGGEGASGGWFA